MGVGVLRNWFRPFLLAALGGAAFAVVAVQYPLAAGDWLLLSAGVVWAIALLSGLAALALAGRAQRRYRDETWTFRRFAHSLGTAERLGFACGQWTGLALALSVAALLSLALPGQAVLAALATPAFATALAVLPGVFPGPRLTDVGLLAHVDPQALTRPLRPLSDSRHAFAPAWRLRARLVALRRAAVARPPVDPAREFLAALDNGQGIRPAAPARAFHPIAAARLRARGLMPVVLASAPAMLAAWLLAALLPVGLLPQIPTPGELFVLNAPQPQTERPETEQSPPPGNEETDEDAGEGPGESETPGGDGAQGSDGAQGPGSDAGSGQDTGAGETPGGDGAQGSDGAQGPGSEAGSGQDTGAGETPGGDGTQGLDGAQGQGADDGSGPGSGDGETQGGDTQGSDAGPVQTPDPSGRAGVTEAGTGGTPGGGAAKEQVEQGAGAAGEPVTQGAAADEEPTGDGAAVVEDGATLVARDDRRGQAVEIGTGSEAETRLPVTVEGEAGDDGPELEVRQPRAHFAGPGAAPEMIETDLPDRGLPDVPLPPRPPHQRLPAWIADLYR